MIPHFNSQLNQLDKSQAIVSLGQLCLSTVLLHAYWNSSLWNTPYEKRGIDEEVRFMLAQHWHNIGFWLLNCLVGGWNGAMDGASE